MSTRFLPPPTVINKYKRRRFQKTKNLLTGETEADPEMIKVSTEAWSGPGGVSRSQPRGHPPSSRLARLLSHGGAWQSRLSP